MQIAVEGDAQHRGRRMLIRAVTARTGAGRTMADQVSLSARAASSAVGNMGVNPFLIINCKELYYAEKTIATSVSGKVTTPGRPAAADISRGPLPDPFLSCADS